MKILIDNAVARLARGEVICIPTDTIYGFAAKPGFEEKIFELKQRPKTNPLVLFLDSVDSLPQFIREIPPGGKDLMEAHWPGPLTLVLPGIFVETLAIRIPDHPLILSLLKETGPLFVTSANLSGTPPLLTAPEIEHSFGTHFPILEGTVPKQGLPSTILSYKEHFWKVDRLGALTKWVIPVIV